MFGTCCMLACSPLQIIQVLLVLVRHGRTARNSPFKPMEFEVVANVFRNRSGPLLSDASGQQLPKSGKPCDDESNFSLIRAAASLTCLRPLDCFWVIQSEHRASIGPVTWFIQPLKPQRQSLSPNRLETESNTRLFSNFWENVRFGPNGNMIGEPKM